MKMSTDLLEDIFEIAEQDYQKNELQCLGEHLEPFLKKTRSDMDISDDVVCQFYRYLLSGGCIPKVTNQHDLDLLTSTYKEIDHNNKPVNKFMFLLIFGYHGKYKIDESNALNIHDFKLYLSAWSQFNKYTNMRNMGTKKDKFIPFAECNSLTEHLTKILKVTEGNCTFTETLSYWAMIFTVLLNDTKALDFLDYLIENESDIESLDFFVSATNNPQLKLHFNQIQTNS